MITVMSARARPRYRIRYVPDSRGPRWRLDKKYWFGWMNIGRSMHQSMVEDQLRGLVKKNPSPDNPICYFDASGAPLP